MQTYADIGCQLMCECAIVSGDLRQGKYLHLVHGTYLNSYPRKINPCQPGRYKAAVCTGQ